MFVKPIGSKAIPIVKPDDEGKKTTSRAAPLPQCQVDAIKDAANAANAISSLKIGNKAIKTFPGTVPVSNPVPNRALNPIPVNMVPSSVQGHSPGPVPIPNPILSSVPNPVSNPVPNPVADLNGNHNPDSASMIEMEPNKPWALTDSDQDGEPGFDIYARPFVPEIFSVINTLSGRQQIFTPPKKSINFENYVSMSFGPTVGFLPHLPMNSSRETSTTNLSSHVDFLQFHLDEEIQEQEAENKTYSLYGHEVTVQPPSSSYQQYQRQGEAICTLQVPGLNENSPFVEEDDFVELRELVYGTDDGLYGMQTWLAARKAHAANANLPYSRWDVGQQDLAPGWTNRVYVARVLSAQRLTETLILRVLGLPGSGSMAERKARFNIQFPCSTERHYLMFSALPITHQVLSQCNGNSVDDVHTTASHWLQSMLMPNPKDCAMQNKLHPGVFQQHFFDEEINWEQRKAVESIWSRNYGNLPFLISGPPGTGKTKTLIETTLQLIKNMADHSHILLCAPSDPAADTLAQRLRTHLSTRELLRLNRPYRTFAEVDGALLPYCCIVDDQFTLPAFPAIMQYRVVVTTCRDASLLSRARLTNMDLYTVEQRVQSITRSIHPLDHLPEPKLHWSALLVDEAAQATEPEVLIPLSVVAPPLNPPSSSKPLFVMAGDEHQLGPRTSLPLSPLEVSLFARLSKRRVYAAHPLARGRGGKAPPPLTQSLLPIHRPAFANLIRNYRSHPAILTVPSSLFYFDTLVPEAKDTDCLADWHGWRGRGWPVLFHNNPSRDELAPLGLKEGMGGWYNPGEADIACQYAAALVNSGLIAQDQVCIMSPFKAQVTRLRQRMRDPKYGGMWNVNIGPTEAFQGLERGVVILCVTRARQRFVEKDQRLGWGLIGMPNKMNVALTRAKYGLIVIGSRDLLMEDPMWKAFVDFCERNGLVTDDTASEGAKPTHGLTRLEKELIEERAPEPEAFHQGWGMSYPAGPDEEMWTHGMMETPSHIFGDSEDDEFYQRGVDDPEDGY